MLQAITNSKTGALECKSSGVAGKQSKYDIICVILPYKSIMEY